MVTWRWWWVLVVETIWFATLSYQFSYSIFGLRDWGVCQKNVTGLMRNAKNLESRKLLKKV